MPFTDKEKRNAYMREYRARKRADNSPPMPVRADCKEDAGDVVAQWAESSLLVPTGPLRGQPYKLDSWQREWLTNALAPNIREAGLSVARKNGKSGLVAALLLAHLCGPLNGPNWRGVVVSLTGALAAELREAIRQTAEISGLIDRLTIKASPPPGSITGQDGATLTILASDKATGHAIGCDIATIDESGLIPESGRELWNAVLSSVSGRDGRLLCISIRGHGPMFSELAERAGSPGVHWQEFAAPEGCALDDEKAWELANPGLASRIKSRAYMVDAARRAIAVPADASLFRAYDLNQPLNPSKESICQPSEWVACERKELPARQGGCVVGFDLGGSSSMTALAAFWPSTGRLEAWGAFPDNPSLAERGRADGVGGLYEQMAARGELRTYRGRVTPVADFLADCAERLAGERILASGADRYRRAEAETALEDAGLDWLCEWRGQGASAGADGSHDVRSFQRLVLGGRLAVAESLLLRSAVASSELRYDNAGNPALDKRKARARIDALSAAVIAAGLGEMYQNAPARNTAPYIGLAG